MLTFDQVYKIVEESGNEASFNREECQTLYGLSHMITGDALEIGVQFGRSLTVLGLVAKDKGFRVYGVDNWLEDVSGDAKQHAEEKIKKYDLPITLVNESSVEAFFNPLLEKFDLVHIDGDHTYQGVVNDIVLWKTRLNSGGYMCFDDYGHDSLPDVYKAVQAYITEEEFNFVGRYGNKLGVFQKI